MPKNKRESLIYTVLMCAFMVYWMSVYNISLRIGFSKEAFRHAWMGFPMAYVVGLILDWFVVSRSAKKMAFKIVKPESKTIHKIVVVSGSMVCGMVLFMSLYGAIEGVGFTNDLWLAWLKNIPMNFIMAVPVQLLIAGPFVRWGFRKLFPEGTVLA